MIRLSPCDDPKACPGENCSNPRTLWPRFARWYNAALPMAPSPTTMQSYRRIDRASTLRGEALERALLGLGHFLFTIARRRVDHQRPHELLRRFSDFFDREIE